MKPPNPNFSEIKDETDYLWAYLFRGKLGGFISLANKYQGLNKEKPVVFKELEFNKAEFEGIFEKNIKVVLEDCELKMIGLCTLHDADLSIKSGIFRTGSLSLSGCKNSKIEIKEAENLSGIYLTDSGDISVFLKDIKFSKVYFSNNKNLAFGAENLEFNDLTCKSTAFSKIEISQCNGKNLNFTGVSGGELSVKNSSGTELKIIDEPLYVGNLDKVGFQTVEFSNLKFDSVILKPQKGENLNIQKLSISGTNNVEVTKCKIETLRVSGEQLENFILLFCKVSMLVLSFFKVKSRVVFDGLDISEGELCLQNALLKDLEVNPSFFHVLKEIKYDSSSIEGIKINAFKPISPDVIRNGKDLVENKIDLCRELTYLLTEQNNRHYATVYRALELELRPKSKDSTLTWFDRQVLNLNFWSNVHGTMPQKALFWIMVLSLIHFSLVNLNLFLITGMPYEAGLDLLSQNYAYYLKPLTFLSDIEKTYLPFGSENIKVSFHPLMKFLDLLYKILYAYLLYQFVAAFRKFSK